MYVGTTGQSQILEKSGLRPPPSIRLGLAPILLAEIPSTLSENSVTVPHLALRTTNVHNTEPHVEHNISSHTAGQARHE
jgi:hypothetical protein